MLADYADRSQHSLGDVAQAAWCSGSTHIASLTFALLKLRKILHCCRHVGPLTLFTGCTGLGDCVHLGFCV